VKIGTMAAHLVAAGDRAEALESLVPLATGGGVAERCSKTA
jgi:hypothetical protein